MIYQCFFNLHDWTFKAANAWHFKNQGEYRPILLTVCNYISMRKVIKCLNQLNHKRTGTFKLLETLFSLEP